MKPAYQTPRPTPPSEIHTSAPRDKKAFKSAKRRTTGSPSAPSIELYQKENCALSHAVRSRLTELGLDFVAHTVPDGHPLKHEQLIQAGGKDQVPFLIDHTSGIKLYESPAILAYLDKTYGKTESKAWSVRWVDRLAKNIDLQIRSRADLIAWSLSSPLLKAQTLRYNAQGAIQTLEGTWDYLKSRIEAAMHEAEFSAADSSDGSSTHTSVDTHEDDDQTKADNATPVKAQVVSATEAA